MPPQYPQNPQITDEDRERAELSRRMRLARAKLDEMAKPNVPKGYTLVRETPDGGKIYRKPDGQLTFTSSGYGTNNQAEIQRMMQGMAPGQARRAETNKQIVEQDGVRGAAASAIKGLPFIGEYFDEAVGMMTGDPRTTAALRETTAAYEQQKPLEALGLQMGLGTAATLPLVPFQAVGNAIKAAPSMGRAMLGGLGIGAGAGAVEGAVAGFGAGEGSAEQRLPSAQTGAVIGGALGGALGAAAAPMEAGVRSALQNWSKSVPPNVLDGTPPLDLSNRVYAPGQPDPLGFITSAERALANPPARFRDAKALSPEQWRKFMREGGASKEAFTNQIEPALKSLGETGDITREAFEEALARNRTTLQVDTSKGDPIEGVLGETPNMNRDYSEYVAPGPSKRYRQEVVVVPGLDYKSHNWNTKGALGHIRTTDRNAATGEKVRHVEELQSDLHQEAAKYGYKGDTTPVDLRALERNVRAARLRYREWAAEANRKRPVNKGTYPVDEVGPAALSLIDDPVGKELYRTAVEANRRSVEATRTQTGQPPRAPLENWEEPFVRYALQQAAKDGVNTVTFPTHGTLHSALQNEGTKSFYDKRLPSTLGRVAKSLGLKVEAVDLDVNAPRAAEIDATLGQKPRERRATVPAIRLTPEAKAELAKGVVMDAAGNAGRNSKRAQ